jgi:DNA-binding IclR family transcriptional regulator
VAVAAAVPVVVANDSARTDGVLVAVARTSSTTAVVVSVAVGRGAFAVRKRVGSDHELNHCSGGHCCGRSLSIAAEHESATGRVVSAAVRKRVGSDHRFNHHSSGRRCGRSQSVAAEREFNHRR